MKTKKCSKCNEEKELICFGKSKSSKDGLRYQCKSCRKLERQNLDYKRSWYLQNKDKHRAKNKEWIANNSDKIQKYKENWYIENKAKISEKSSQKFYEKRQKELSLLAIKNNGKDPLIGKTILNWTILSKQSDKIQNFICKCICGFLQTQGKILLIGKLPEKCLECGLTERPETEIDILYWRSIVDGAIKRDIEFNITIEEAWKIWLNQKGKCKLSGLEINLKQENKPQTASLDRIDSAKSYTIDNIQWVHRHINKMKLDFDEEYFKFLCINIVKELINE